MRIVFWGSSDFSLPTLEHLGKKGWITAVVTNPDKPYGRGLHTVHQTPVKQWAQHHGLTCLQPARLKDSDFLHTLAALNADLFVVVSYGRILPSEVLSLPERGSVNLHASLLPRYRGASPIQTALFNDDTSTGNTIQYMSEALDEGDVILQSTIDIEPYDTYPTLSAKLAHDGAHLMVKAVALIEEGRTHRTPQNHTEATHTHRIAREDGAISLCDMTAHEMYCRWRAYQPWPGIFTTYSQSKEPIVVHFTDIAEIKAAGEPGTVVQADKTGLVVACKDNGLRLNRLKPSGKKEIDFLGFINGYRVEIGKKF